MVAQIKIVNLKEVMAYLKDIPYGTFGIAKEEIAKALFQADEDIKTNTDLKRRTGQLFKSIKTQVEGKDLNSLQASISTDMIYAPIHEFGGTIRAIDKYVNVPGGPYLNIPTRLNKTPAGVTRLSARDIFKQGGHIVKFRSGKYGLMLDGNVLYTLHKQVEIPPRLHMVESTESQVPTMLSRIADRIGED